MTNGKALFFGAVLFALFMLTMCAVNAQTALPTPETQALQQSLMNEINSNLQCRASVIALQRDINDLHQRLAKAEKDANGAPAAKKEDRLPMKK